MSRPLPIARTGDSPVLSTFERLRAGYGRILEAVVILLMVALSVEVVAGVVFRAIGRSLSWYDEIASILLAWLTYYGAALAALKRAHIGFPGLVMSLPTRWRIVAVIFAEACVLGFFALLAWVGVRVLDVLATDTLVSLPHISVAWVQSVIPVSAVLIILAELLNLPQLLARTRGRETSTSGAEIETSH